MAEPTREQIAEAQRLVLNQPHDRGCDSHYDDGFGHREQCDCWQGTVYDVLARCSQPTPTAEQWATTTEYAYGALDAPDIIVPTGEDIDDLGTARYNAEEFWIDVLQRTVKRGPWTVVPAEADPSTIRDVTPPAGGDGG